MDNGNGGPGNRIAQGFEQLAETTEFNVENKSPEILPTPDDQQEKDPYAGLESVSDNLNGAPGMIDPAMLGGLSLEASQVEEKKEPGLGEIVDEKPQDLTGLSEEKVLGTDISTSKFQKNGVTKEMEARLDGLKKEDDLYKLSVDFMRASKESLGTSFADRNYLIGGATEEKGKVISFPKRNNQLGKAA